jgi:hypothetical protein
MARKIYRVPTKKGYTKIRLDTGKTWQEVYGKQRCRKCKQHFKESELYTFADDYDPSHFKHIDCKHPKKIEEEIISVPELPTPRSRKARSRN